jgi:nucleotide-binding universal stress UspA family protein
MVGGSRPPTMSGAVVGPDWSAERQGGGQFGATVVVGLDGSETSWDSLWWACGEARRLGGRAVAVFVSPAVEAGTGLAAWAGLGVLVHAEIERANYERSEQLCTEVERHAAGHDLNLTFVHAHGEPARELVRVAEETHADLIVVGRSAKAYHLLAGSIGRRLVAKRGAPVVAVVP